MLFTRLLRSPLARRLRVVALVGLGLASAAGLHAQSAGTVAGRITDARTKLVLGGARVGVAGSGLNTYADSAGDYVLAGVPAGPATLEVAYVGYADERKTVTVAAGSTTKLDVAFGADVVALDRFVITGNAVGTARALNRQRAAASYTSIVAADEIGRFPDQNAAESLQRLPGVSLYRDQGEGRFIVLRGLNYIYTPVSLDGARLASPERGDRAAALDVIPSDALAALEVTKVLTPDLDGEGLGGAVNIKSKSPFDAAGRDAQVSVQSIYTRLTDDFGYKGNATFSDIFSGGKLGLLASMTWQERDFGSHNFEEDGYSRRGLNATSPQFYALDSLGFRDYAITRERYGASGAVEWKPDAFTTLYVRGAYNRFIDTEDRHQLYLPFSRGAVAAIGGSSLAVTGLSRVRRDIRIREKDQELSALSAGFEKQAGDWTVDGRLGLSHGEETRPDELTVRLRRNTADTGLRYEFNSQPYNLALTQTAGASVLDPASYNAVDRIELANDGGTEEEVNAALNIRYALDAATPGFVKFGGSYRAKEKESYSDVSRFAAPTSFTFASLAEAANSDYPFGLRVPRLSHNAVLAAFNGNRAAFTGTVLQPDSVLEDWVSQEDVLAGYGLVSLTRGRSTWLAGARYERTEFKTAGNQIRGGGISPTRASRDYDHFLPSVHFRHDFSKNLVARAAYSTSLARPAFGETAIYRNIVDNDLDVVAGNPDLRALKSKNWDASVEYYLPSLGVVSAAVFLKDVSNFSYAFVAPGGDPAFPTYDLLTFRNGSDGEIRGLELAWVQPLRFLPAPLDGFGLMANGTFVDSEAKYPTRPGETLPFIGQSDFTGNFALTYEKHRFFARLALNYRSEHLREDEPIGDNVNGDRVIDDFKQLDLTVGYTFNRHLEVFGEVTNLTNEPFRVHFKSDNGQGARLVQFEEYNWTANFGLRWKL